MNSPRSKWVQWAGKLTLFSGFELASRLLQMVCALLVVRFMEKEQYAWYSLAIGFQGMLGFITMIGAGAALYAIGGPLIEDRKAMGGLVRSVKKWRRFLLLVSFPVILPVFGFLLFRNDCPPVTIGLLLILAAGMIILEIQRHLLAAPLELALRFNLLQKIEVVAAAVRLLALLLLISTAWMSAVSVLLVATLLVGWIPLLMLPKHTAALADPTAEEPGPEIQLRIRNLSIAALPGALSYILEAQFAGIFVALAGHTEGVADLGALSRLGLLLSIPAALLYKIIQPKLATITHDKTLLAAWKATLAFGFVVGIGMIVGVWIFSDWLLLILGPGYQELHPELFYFSCFQALSFFTNANASMLEARGWLKRSWLRPLAVLGSMTVAAFLLPITTVHGAIGLMIVGCAGNLLVDLILVFLGFRGKSDV